MRTFTVSSRDQNCRYLAHPASSIVTSQFVTRLESFGIRIPSRAWLEGAISRRWITPRIRIPLPSEALLSWTNFPTHTRVGAETCPLEHEWGLGVWDEATFTAPAALPAVEKLWMHWLDDPESELGQIARGHAIDPHDEAATPKPFRHPQRDVEVRPWIDYFAHWQAFHVAELLQDATYSHVVQPHGDHPCSQGCLAHAEQFAIRVEVLRKRWERDGVVFDWISSWRTIQSHLARHRDDFDALATEGARAWALRAEITGDRVRACICDVLLRLWRTWHRRPPLASAQLLRALQVDIDHAVRLLEVLTDQPTNPFDPCWHWNDRSLRGNAPLVEALPHEEWLARRDFARSAVPYQRGFPLGSAWNAERLSQEISAAWDSCVPLRRFCLAWVRLHAELRGRDRDLPATATIEAQERIEQVNLIALHTERVLRYVAKQFPHDERKQPGSTQIFADAARRASAKIVPGGMPESFCPSWILSRRTQLHAMPLRDRILCTPEDVKSGCAVTDFVVSAHCNALIARNYAAHHEYLDDDLIFPANEDLKPHLGATLLSSCLFVVIAALRSMSDRRGPTGE